MSIEEENAELRRLLQESRQLLELATADAARAWKEYADLMRRMAPKGESNG